MFNEIEDKVIELLKQEMSPLVAKKNIKRDSPDLTGNFSGVLPALSFINVDFEIKQESFMGKGKVLKLLEFQDWSGDGATKEMMLEHNPIFKTFEMKRPIQIRSYLSLPVSGSNTKVDIVFDIHYKKIQRVRLYAEGDSEDNPRHESGTLSALPSRYHYLEKGLPGDKRYYILVDVNGKQLKQWHPLPPGVPDVYQDGLDYNIDGKTIIFNTAPEEGINNLIFIYLPDKEESLAQVRVMKFEILYHLSSWANKQNKANEIVEKALAVLAGIEEKLISEPDAGYKFHGIKPMEGRSQKLTVRKKSIFQKQIDCRVECDFMAKIPGRAISEIPVEDISRFSIKRDRNAL